ncbi:MAG: metallophosphoesterase [Alistipes sp.]|nr:metallophosphoesterase [Alistipes sp.]
MLQILFTLIVFGLLGRDLRQLYRYRRAASHGVHVGRLGCWIAIDLLPILLMAGFLFDNPSWVMRGSMWIMWLWITISAARLCYGFFTLLKLRTVGIALATLGVAAMLYGALWGRQALRVEEQEICSASLPESFDGYRIAFFSDLHLGALVNTQKEVGQVVQQLNALNPDVVLFGGDLVNIRHSELDAQATQLLQGIHAPVYAVIGNHDVGTYIGDTISLPAEVSYRRLVEQEEAMGWCILQDSTCYLKRDADSIALSGFTFDPQFKKERHDRILPLTGAEQGYNHVPTDLFNITMTHIPQHWDEIRALGYGDLTLSGHTHAMQLKLRLGKGRGCSPARLIYPRWGGRYDEQGSTLYINEGIGYVIYPMRIGARPEITLITLKRCE